MQKHDQEYHLPNQGKGGGGTPCNGLYGEASPERGTFQASDPWKGSNFIIWSILKCGEICHVSKRTKILKDALYGCERLRKLHDLVIYSD